MARITQIRAQLAQLHSERVAILAGRSAQTEQAMENQSSRFGVEQNTPTMRANLKQGLRAFGSSEGVTEELLVAQTRLEMVEAQILELEHELGELQMPEVLRGARPANVSKQLGREVAVGAAASVAANVAINTLTLKRPGIFKRMTHRAGRGMRSVLGATAAVSARVLVAATLPRVKAAARGAINVGSFYARAASAAVKRRSRNLLGDIKNVGMDALMRLRIAGLSI